MFWIRLCSYMTQIIKDWGYWRQKRLSTKFKTVTNIFYLETETRLAIILNLIRNRSKLNSNCFTANSKISTDNPEDGLGSNSRDGPHMIVDTWLYFKNLSFIMLKGSPDPSHFIFEINLGKRRIRYATTQNSNDAIFNRFWVYAQMPTT